MSRLLMRCSVISLLLLVSLGASCSHRSSKPLETNLIHLGLEVDTVVNNVADEAGRLYKSNEMTKEEYNATIRHCADVNDFQINSVIPALQRLEKDKSSDAKYIAVTEINVLLSKLPNLHSEGDEPVQAKLFIQVAPVYESARKLFGAIQ